MPTTIRVTNDVHSRLKLLKADMEKEVGAPLTWSIIFSNMAKKEGY